MRSKPLYLALLLAACSHDSAKSASADMAMGGGDAGTADLSSHADLSLVDLSLADLSLADLQSSGDLANTLQGSVAYPLSASANGRYLVDKNGKPFFMVGGSPQLLAHLSMSDASAYLSARAAQGFNSIQMYTFPWDFGAAGSAGGDHSLPGGNGAYPFVSKLGGGAYAGVSGTADFSTPNSGYFDYLDQILDVSAQMGFFIHLYAVDFGYGGDGEQGWWPDVKANSTAALQGLGQYLGNRYKDRTNIIWVDGSDYGQSSPNPPDATNEGKVLQLVMAMQTAGAKQLRSGDWNSPSLSTDEPLFEKLMQLNGIYSYGAVYPQGSPNSGVTYPQSRVGWKYAPVAASQGNPGAASIPPALPAYLKETDYEGSAFSPGDAASVRRAQYWSVLSGGTAGLFFENESVLRGTAGWQALLNSTGALDVKRMSALFQGYDWWKLVPSELSGMRLLVTSANGSQNGAPTDYVAAAQAADGSFMLAYVPPAGNGAQSLTIDLRSMKASARGRWWDPTNDNYSDITGGAYSLDNTTAAQSFTTPGNNSAGANDWILVIDTP